ncbi:MAG TPA: hypothetical protein VNI01_05270 [Elusimicrobiota bacterium]|nr:hypothetical protein [Elusimicrobiota bacterium]
MNWPALRKLLERAMEWAVLRLQNPAHLRILLLTLIGLIGVLGVGVPMRLQIDSLQEQLANEKLRRSLIKSHKDISFTMQKYKKRLPKDGDFDWWLKYLVALAGEMNVTVREMRPVHMENVKIGNMEGVFFYFSLGGDFRDCVRFIGRLENQQNIVHLSRMSFNAGRDGQVTVSMALLTLISTSKPKKDAGTGKKKKGDPADVSDMDDDEGKKDVAGKPAGPPPAKAPAKPPAPPPGVASSTETAKAAAAAPVPVKTASGPPAPAKPPVSPPPAPKPPVPEPAPAPVVGRGSAKVLAAPPSGSGAAAVKAPPAAPEPTPVKAAAPAPGMGSAKVLSSPPAPKQGAAADAADEGAPEPAAPPADGAATMGTWKVIIREGKTGGP